MRIGFPLLRTGKRGLFREWGVVWPLVKTIKRVTFLVDPDGIVRGVFHHELAMGRHLADVVKHLEAIRGRAPA